MAQVIGQALLAQSAEQPPCKRLVIGSSPMEGFRHSAHHLGHQVSILSMSPDNYEFTGRARVGPPLTLLVRMILLRVLTTFWPVRVRGVRDVSTRSVGCIPSYPYPLR